MRGPHSLNPGCVDARGARMGNLSRGRDMCTRLARWPGGDTARQAWLLVVLLEGEVLWW